MNDNSSNGRQADSFEPTNGEYGQPTDGCRDGSDESVVTDGGEDQVWLRSAKDGSAAKFFHTDPDCSALANANGTKRRSLSVLPDDIQECRRCAGEVKQDRSGPGGPHERLSEMDPDEFDELIADGGQVQPVADEVTTPQDLSLFQQEILVALAEHGAQHGLGIKSVLQERYGEIINHGRLYPNLDDLVEKGLLDKAQRDGRTNEYELTERGLELLRQDVQRRYLAVTDEYRDLWEVDA